MKSAIEKAVEDAVLYGIGYYYVDENGSHYLDPKTVVIIEVKDSENESKDPD